MFKRSFLVVALCLVSLGASAATVQKVSGDLTAAVLFSADFSIVTAIDIRSNAAFLAEAGGNPLGIVLTSDVGGASPNPTLLVLNLAATEGGIFNFITGLATFSGDLQALRIPVGSAAFGVITDPALQVLFTTQAFNFGFQSIIGRDDNSILALFAYSSLELPVEETVPEPSTALAGFVAIGFALYRFRRRS